MSGKQRNFQKNQVLSSLLSVVKPLSALGSQRELSVSLPVCQKIYYTAAKKNNSNWRSEDIAGGAGYISIECKQNILPYLSLIQRCIHFARTNWPVHVLTYVNCYILEIIYLWM